MSDALARSRDGRLHSIDSRSEPLIAGAIAEKRRAQRRRAPNSTKPLLGGHVSAIEETNPIEAVARRKGRGLFTSFPPATHQCKSQDPPSETTMNNATQDAGFDISIGSRSDGLG